MTKKLLLATAFMLTLAACSDENSNDKQGAVPAPTREQVLFAEDAEPADARLADIYVTSCGACHTVPESGAPLTGYTAAWTPRMEAKGMAALIASSKTGLNAMPPMGQCPDCTDDDFEALITFMMTGE
ncbi:MAG: c-type cytochrome [Alphaproteobacteria bacterium]